MKEDYAKTEGICYLIKIIYVLFYGFPVIGEFGIILNFSFKLN